MRTIKMAATLAVCIALSSCGIFKKGCNCPHFGNINFKKHWIVNLS